MSRLGLMAVMGKLRDKVYAAVLLHKMPGPTNLGPVRCSYSEKDFHITRMIPGCSTVLVPRGPSSILRHR